MGHPPPAKLVGVGTRAIPFVGTFLGGVSLARDIAAAGASFDTCMKPGS